MGGVLRLGLITALRGGAGLDLGNLLVYKDGVLLVGKQLCQNTGLRRIDRYIDLQQRSIARVS